MVISTPKSAARYLLGRTIVAVDLNEFEDDEGGKCTDPVIVLDNGSQLRFVVQEAPGVGEYGVCICRDAIAGGRSQGRR